MGEEAKIFIPRSPRYVLRAQDRSDMRFSLEHTLGKGGIEKTILLNLSESGCAFLVNSGFEPNLGERIKVEVPIPSGDQIAWWGKVVRISEYQSHNWGFSQDQFARDSKVLVALRFDTLPEPFSRAIRKGIKQSLLKAMRDQQYRTWIYYRTLIMEHAVQAILYVVLTAFVISFIYMFTRPDSKYDAKRGTPWGDRFKF